MLHPTRRFLILLQAALVLAALFPAPSSLADDDDKPAPTAPGTPDRYGPFGLLDHRSRYGHDWFPELFRVDESDTSDSLRLDYQHLQRKTFRDNRLTAQAEKSFGLLTLEIQAPYVLDTSLDGARDDATPLRGRGVATIDLSARIPVYQFVSPSGSFDNTFGVGMGVGLPTNSPVSKNAEIAPRIFDDLRLGSHLSIQILAGPNWLLGTLPADGRRSFEYGVGIGYSIEDEQLPLPHIERTIPILELVGETGLSRPRTGHNALTGTAGVRFELKPVAHLHPQFGLAYIFPLDKGGRDQLHWGLLASLVFDF